MTIRREKDDQNFVVVSVPDKGQDLESLRVWNKTQGGIWVESQPGKGANFIFKLPKSN